MIQKLKLKLIGELKIAPMNALLLLAVAYAYCTAHTWVRVSSLWLLYGYADHRNQQVLLLFGFDLCCHLDVNKYMYSFMSVNHFVFFCVTGMETLF